MARGVDRGLGRRVCGSSASRGSAPLPEIATSVAAAPDEIVAPAEKSPLRIPDRFGRGDTLSSVLLRNGFDDLEVHEMGRALSAVMDVRHLREGDEVEIRFEGLRARIGPRSSRGSRERPSGPFRSRMAFGAERGRSRASDGRDRGSPRGQSLSQHGRARRRGPAHRRLRERVLVGLRFRNPEPRG